MLKTTPLCFFWLFAVAAPLLAQNSQPASAPKGAQLTADSFTAHGLTLQDTLTKLYTGDFLGIDFDRNDPKFNGIFDQYLVAYSRHCEQALPADKVEMTKRECDSVDTTEVWQGATLISRNSHCNNPHTVHVGWAKPALYSAKKEVDRQRAGDTGRELSVMAGGIPKQTLVSDMMAKLAAARAASSDMDALVQMQNGCKSVGLERFEDNLRLFALNKQPIRLDGSTGSDGAVTPGTPFKDQNYTRLMTELVEDDAQKWGALAKYVPGGVGSASVTSRDDQGRPSKIVSSYVWANFLGGKTQGSVTLTFTDGLPDCFTYSETPTVCHAANRKIVAAYAKNGYSQ
jgi:hypothetical protein